MTDESVEAAIFRALDSLNETLPAAHRVRLERSSSLKSLESLAITNLIVAVEDAVRDAFDVEISLTDERTLALLQSETETPMRTVETLIAHVTQAIRRLDGAGGGARA